MVKHNATKPTIEEWVRKFIYSTAWIRSCCSVGLRKLVLSVHEGLAIVGYM